MRELTPSVGYVGDLHLVEKGVRSFGDSEQFRGELDDYRVSIGWLDPSMDVRLGREYPLCGRTVDISVVGWTWNVVVESPSDHRFVAVALEHADNAAGHERLLDGTSESTLGLYHAIEILTDLRIASAEWRPLPCSFADAKAELLALGFADSVD